MSAASQSQPGIDETVWQTRVDLAAALRFAHRLGFSEGICNHFSAAVPGNPDLFLLNPQGLHWSEICASDLIVVDSNGQLVEGKHKAEPTAFYIHSRIHRAKPDAHCVLHTHMPYATALCCVEGGRLEWCSQNALRFYGRTGTDSHYNGAALDESEGDRIASALSEPNSILFLAHHGVIVTGKSVGQAFDDLYYLERACMHQVLAQSTGLPLRLIPQVVCERFIEQLEEVTEQAQLHFEAIKRILRKEAPEFST
jgi:ribulose-5-phosphate 4-epimerase/fuculose-1-phosphate aldolase